MKRVLQYNDFLAVSLFSWIVLLKEISQDAKRPEGYGLTVEVKGKTAGKYKEDLGKSPIIPLDSTAKNYFCLNLEES